MSSATPSIPSTQQQWTFNHGAGFDGLKLVKDAPVPSVGHGQVLVRIRACSLNYRDLLLIKGQYPAKVAPNTVPLSDGAGDVVAVGEGVTEFKVNDRVAAIFTPKWQGGDNRTGIAYSGSLGGDVQGTLTQYFLIDATGLVKIPDHFTYEEAATLPCAGVTAFNSLTHGRFPIRASSSVLVMGTGGVSLLAAQIARAHGARVIATSSSDDKIERLVKLGYTAKQDTINYTRVKDWGKKAKELTGGIGVDHVVEIGGQGTITEAIEAVRPDGEVTVIGLVADRKNATGIDAMRVLGGGFSVRGVLVGSRADAIDLNAMYEAHKELRPKDIIDKVFPWTEAVEAYKFLESGNHFGKIVIKVD